METKNPLTSTRDKNDLVSFTTLHGLVGESGRDYGGISSI